MLTKEQLLDLSGILATVSMIGVGAAIGGPFGATVMAGIGTSVSGAILPCGHEKLKGWLSSSHGVLNHDIQLALVRAFGKALTHLGEEYFKLGEANALSKNEKASIKAFFRIVKEQKDETFVKCTKALSEQEVKVYLYDEPKAAAKELWKRLAADSLLAPCGEHFRDFLRTNLLDQVMLYFSEELKTDNPECNKAWRAFQRLLLEGMYADVKAVRASQDEIMRYLQTLEAIRRQLDQLKDVIDHRLPNEPFQVGLETAIGEIPKVMVRLEEKLDVVGEKQDVVLRKLDVVVASVSKPVVEIPIDEEPISADIQAELDKGEALDAEYKYAEAASTYENAVKLAESAGNERALIKTRIELGQALTREESNMEQAREVLSACLTDLKTKADPKSRSTVLHLLGHIDICKGRIQEGKALCREALESSRACGDRFQEGCFLISVAHAEEMSGNLPDAHRLLDDAASVFRIEYRESEGREKTRAGINLAGAFVMKAAVYEHEGKVEEMLASLTEAESLCRKENDADNLARSLVSKCRALFAKSKRAEGIKALDEARDIFKRIGNVHWLLKCYDVRARLAFQMDDQKLALTVCMGAIALPAEQGTPEDHTRVLGQTAALCRRNGLDEQAATFHAEAKHLATEHNLTDLLVDLLLDGADIRRSKDERREDDEDGKRIVHEAIAHLEALLVKCEVKGRRAHYLSRIGQLHGRLGNLTEARSRFEQALRNFEEIGDVGGIANSLAMLAATAREEKDKIVAIRLLESLLERSKGKPLQHFQAGAHHDLVSLKMSQGDMAGARKHFDASTSICAGYHMPDVEEALRETQKRLEVAERSRRSTASDLPTMLRDLHAWKDRYPQAADAILPFWYHCFSAELWSNCRSQLGVKFLVRAASAQQFASFADNWSLLGDLFIYAANFALRSERGIDLFPWPDEMKVPVHMPCGFLKGPEVKSMEGEEGAKALIKALEEVPYFLTIFSGKVPGFPDANAFIVGRRYRVPDEIRDLMFGASVESLISRRLVAMPVRERDDDTSLIHDMCVAWENRLLPVFFGSLPTDGETSLERTVRLPFPRAESVKKNEGSTSSNARRSLRTFMAEVGGNPDVALTQLADALNADTVNDKSEMVTASLHVIGFNAGATQVHHPALVVASRP